MYARRTDANHAEIIKELKQAFCTVVDLSKVGKGCPDLLVGHNKINYLVEIKTKTGYLTDTQIDFIAAWKGLDIIVGTDFESIFSQIKRLSKKR